MGLSEAAEVEQAIEEADESTSEFLKKAALRRSQEVLDE
jgi:hypothetical protein